MKKIQPFIFAALIAATTPAFAQSLSWDGNNSGGSNLGGSGNWDTNVDALWFNGAVDVFWTNGLTADFSGTAGTVTLIDNISAANLYFTNTTGNYYITNATGAEVLNVANTIDTGGSEDTIAVQIGNSTTLTKNGNGRLHLPVDSTATLTGSFVVNQGQVSIETNNAAGLGTTLTVNNGATVEFNSGNTNDFNMLNVMTVGGSGVTNEGALVNVSGATILTGPLTLSTNTLINCESGNLVYNANSQQGAGAGINTSGVGNYNVVVEGPGQFNNGSKGFNIGTGTLSLENGVIFLQYVTGTGSSTSFSATYIGTNCQYLTEGDEDFGTAPGALMTTNVILDGGILNNFNTVTMNANRGITVTAAGGMLTNASTSGTWTTGSIYSTNSVYGSNANLTVAAAGSSTIALAVSSSSANLLNIGSGTLTLNNGNTKLQSGVSDVFSNLVINNSTFTFNYDSTSGQPDNLGSVPSTASVSNIWLNGGQFHVGHSTTIQANRGIYVTSAGTLIEEVTSGGTATISTPISGPGAVNFDGNNVVLGANNSYGATTVGGGTVKVGNAGGTGTLGTGNTTDSATLDFNRTGTYTYNGNISGSGAVANIASGTVTLGGSNTYSGATTVSAGTLLLNVITNVGAVTVSSGGTLGGTGNLGGTVTVSAGGTLALGTGTLSVSNNVSIAGNVSVSVNNSSSPSSGEAIVTGTLANTGTGTVNVSNLGPALVTGNTFQIFSQSLANGNNMTIAGGGVQWANNLASSGSISVVGPLPQPVINKVSYSGTSLIMSGTNGYTGGGYYVLATTNLLLPLTSWTPVLTNTFATGGTFSITNPVVAGTPARFYTLKLQ